MRKTINLFVLAIFAMLLVGCNHNPVKPEVQIVYKTKVVYLTPPLNLLERVTLEQPPEKAEFLAMNDKQRVDVLTNKYINQTKQVAQCNRNLEGVEKWIEKQLVLHKEQEEKK